MKEYKDMTNEELLDTLEKLIDSREDSFAEYDEFLEEAPLVRNEILSRMNK